VVDPKQQKKLDQASSKLANVISVLHRSQSMAGRPVILLAEFMMDALLQPQGNPLRRCSDPRRGAYEIAEL
jgi:hypothetical protein